MLNKSSVEQHYKSPVSATNGTRAALTFMGVVIGAHGIKGDIKIKSFTSTQEHLCNYGTLTDITGTNNYELKIKKIMKNYLIGKLPEINCRNEAEKVKGLEFYLHKEKLPKTLDNEYYYSDLIGLKVYLENRGRFGEVLGIHNFGAGDILEIQSLKGKKILIPFTEEVVPEINLRLEAITISQLDGLTQ